MWPRPWIALSKAQSELTSEHLNACCASLLLLSTVHMISAPSGVQDVASIVDASDEWELAMHLPSIFAEIIAMGRKHRAKGQPDYNGLRNRILETGRPKLHRTQCGARAPTLVLQCKSVTPQPNPS